MGLSAFRTYSLFSKAYFLQDPEVKQMGRQMGKSLFTNAWFFPFKEKGKEGLNTHCWEREHRLSSCHRGTYPLNAACPRVVVIYISKHATFPWLKTSHKWEVISCNVGSWTCFIWGAEAAAMGASRAPSPGNAFLTPEIRTSGLRTDPSLQKPQSSLDIQGWHQEGWN